MMLTWTNPVTPDFAGATIRYRADAFPSGPTDGILLADRTNAPDTTDSFTHTGVASGTTCYYAVFAHDEVPNYAVAATISKTFWPADLDDDGDVDQIDFGRFQACYSGDGQSYGPDCPVADLSGDGDVDEEDFGVFRNCLSGQGSPPGWH